MTTTEPTATEAVSTTDRGSRRRLIRRIIAGSLGTGAVLAAVLTLGVFAGGPEPVITGAALLGFAVGWAMLAVLSARMTDQPQQSSRIRSTLVFVDAGDGNWLLCHEHHSPFATSA
ncbi:hypothetical protein ACI782_21580 [Geodermatophilus sp. SYSU D00703]